MKTTIPAETLQLLNPILTAVEETDPVDGCITRMRLVDGATWSEISAAVDMSRSAVSARFSAVLGMLLKALTRLDSDETR